MNTFTLNIPDELMPHVTNLQRAVIEHAKDNCRREARRILIAHTSAAAAEGMECDHIDGNPFNNDPNNLQWLTPKQNKAKSGMRRRDYYGVTVA